MTSTVELVRMKNDYDNEEDNLTPDDSIHLDKEIRVQQQEFKFTDLQVEDIIIVPVGDNPITYQPAQITKLEDSRNIYIDYLVPNFDHPEVLVKSDSEDYKNWVIPLNEIVMKLPEPKEQRRGRIIFKEKIIFFE